MSARKVGTLTLEVDASHIRSLCEETVEGFKALIEASDKLVRVVEAMSPPSRARDIPEIVEALNETRAALASIGGAA